MQDCLPSRSGQAIPYTEYSQHLQRCLSSRFCHASGLTREQAQQPDLLQQGIALLASALESGPRAAATAQQRKTAHHAPRAESTQAGCAADVGARGADPSRQHASIASVHTSVGGACERSNPFSVSMSRPGIYLTPDQAGNPILAGDAQQAHLESGLQGNPGVSISLSGSLDLTAAAEEEAENCSLLSNCLGRNSLGKGMGSAPSPSLSEEWEGWDMQDSLHSPASELLGLPSAHGIEVPGTGLLGRFGSSVASRSPQLANVFQRQTAGVHSPVKASISLHELIPPHGDFEQNLRKHYDEDLAFLEDGSIVRHEELDATGQSDMQTLRYTKQLNKQDVALGRLDEDLPMYNGLGFADAGQAFCKDSLQDLEDPDELDTDLHDKSKLMKDTQGWHKLLPSSTATVTRAVNPDPVAAFSGFCDSLAV